MKTMIAVLAAVLLCACGTTKVPVNATAIHIPDMPPVPTITAASDAGKAARVQVEGAQSNVRAGAAKVAAGDNAGAMPPLSKADSQLSVALSKLDEARAHGVELAANILAQAKAHEAQAAAYQAREKAISDSLKSAMDANAKQAKQILDLKNEVTRTARLWLTSIGAALMLAAVGCAAAFFFAGFAGGLKVGAICGTCGSACLAVATMLAKIILAAQIALGAAALAALAYAAYTLYRHSTGTLENVVTGIQEAKAALADDAKAALAKALSAVTTDADKNLIETLKSKLAT